MWFHRSKHSQVGNPASASGVAIAKTESVLPRAQKTSDGAKSRQKALPDKTYWRGCGQESITDAATLLL